MANNQVVFKYLNSKNVYLDEKEFDFQFDSHPDKTSMLVLSDTLSFFNISNGAIGVDFDKIDNLPDSFMVKLNDNEKGLNYLAFVEKKSDKYELFDELTNKKKSISKSELSKIWGDVVFLIETENFTKEKISGQNKVFYIYTSLLILLLSFILVEVNKDFSELLFFIFSIFGVSLSISASKDLFNTNNFINRFCDNQSAFDCESVISSKKWRIFNFFDFKDLCIVFFVSQLVSFIVFTVSYDMKHYFAIQYILLSLSLLFILASLFYQKFIEKKWCLICLIISCVLLFEFIYLVIFKLFSVSALSLNLVVLYLFLVIAVLTSWELIKKLLSSNKMLRETNIESNRLIRNFNVFNNTLFSRKKIINFPKSVISIGNEKAPVEILLITSPFCAYCKDSHFVLMDLLKKFKNEINVKLIYNCDLKKVKEEKNKRLIRNLLRISSKKDETYFLNALNDWYLNEDIDGWIEKYSTEFNQNEEDLILNELNNWCNNNNFNFTPCLFIDGYKYPDEYSIENLPFYMEELIYSKLKQTAETEKL